MEEALLVGRKEVDLMGELERHSLSVRKLTIKDIKLVDQGEYQYVVDGKDGKQPTSLTASLKAYSVTVEKEKGTKTSRMHGLVTFFI